MNFFEILFICFVYINVLPAFKSAPHACSTHRGQKMASSLGGLELHSHEPPYGFWELNLSQMKEQQPLLLTTEPSV